ncbi:hypothetical protein QL285_031030 [Trifolium repens]|nr:hypothetical protein QL285_080065 [Trifolium repens]KAK2420270.1 hypothetical protein QL285_031030 [Trifolium repens]
MQEFKVKTQRKEENQRKMRKLTRHGQHKASQRQGAPKVARHQVAMASQRRAKSERTQVNSPSSRQGECKASLLAMARRSLARRAKAAKILRADVAETHW